MPRPKQFDEQDVLQKAVMLFWKQGYYHTSIQDLVNHLGINRASLYGTFGGKKALFDRAFQWYRTQQLVRLRAFLERQLNVRTGLRLLFQRIIEDDCADPDAQGCFMVNTTTELVPADVAVQDVLVTHRQSVQAIFATAIARGIEQGNIATDVQPTMIADLLYTLMTGLLVVGKTKADPSSLLATVDAVLSLLDS